MIYDITSKAWAKRTHAGRCCVCYKKFCRTCLECLGSKTGMPCPCTEDCCNECWVKHFMTTAIPCSTPDCNCGKWGVKCPVCRVAITVGPREALWCMQTNERCELIEESESEDSESEESEMNIFL